MLLLSVTSAVVYMGDETKGAIRLTVFNLGSITGLTLLLAHVSGDVGTSVATSLAGVFSFAGFAALVWNRHGRATSETAR